MKRRLNLLIQVWFWIYINMMIAGLALVITFMTLIMCCVLANNTTNSLAIIDLLLFVGSSIVFSAFAAGGVTGLIVTLFFPSPRNWLIFWLVAQVSNLVATVVVVSSIHRSLFYFYYGGWIGMDSLRFLFDVAPVVLASLGSYWAIQRMIKWYAEYHTAAVDPTPQA
ncbi:MAG: hypothetical protein KF726_02780 [Anaerolineae bacterium]|nr:hypothetical protein [Anaerolineae bacterium]